jgi:hypothetical protein
MLSNLPGNLPSILQLLGILTYIVLIAIVLVAGIKQRQWAATLLVAACFYGWPLLVMGGYAAFLFFSGQADGGVLPPER